jgi:hypothetical protein
MKFGWCLALLLLSIDTVQAGSFVQYSLGASQDFNSYSPQSIQRSYFNEFSYYLQMGKWDRLYLGAAYSMISSYQSETDESSTTQSGQNALLSARLYLTKNKVLGITVQYSPLAKLYYATELIEENWTGSAFVIKPGIYPQLTSKLRISIELSYYMATYNKRETISGTSTTESFTRTHAIPSAGLIWDF